MLREQGIVEDTLDYFSRLDYKKDKYKIIIVTTRKEIKDKADGVIRLERLASDLSNSIPQQTIQEKFLGLFSREELKRIVSKYHGATVENIYPQIRQAYLNGPSTKTVATICAKKINRRTGRALVSVVDYPDVVGRMGDQINYVAKKYGNIEKYRNSIFVVYNADSRPNPKTLESVSQTMRIFENQTGTIPNIVQQSSIFTLNYSRLPANIVGYILKAGALFQTKWTLIHELARFRTQSRTVLKVPKKPLDVINSHLSHCVGHGLFVRLNTLISDLLPTETVNEDLPFGFYKCCSGEPILPLALLENSESPETISSLLNQKKVWFWPYLEYLRCRMRVLGTKHYRLKSEVNWLTLQGLVVGIIWFFQSVIFVLPLLIAIYLYSSQLFLFWIFAMLLYWVLPITIIYIKLDTLEKYAGKLVNKRSLTDLIGMLLGGIFIIFTHSVGPMRCLQSCFAASLLHQPITKLKTER